MRVSGAPVGVAVIGCGVVSEQYLRGLGSYPDVRVIACADVDTARAGAVAARFGVPVHGAVERVLAEPDVELVVNLTPPAAHAEVAAAAIEAGRHVYGEKPLALDRTAGQRLLAAAAARGVLVGNAPDTLLSHPLRTVLALTRDGVIGTPFAGTTQTCGPGPDMWHPDPEFFFQYGGGPLFDLGPYHLSALTAVFGPVTRVGATAQRARLKRVIRNGPRAGTPFTVDIPTHVMVLLEFVGGATASARFSFDAAVDAHGPLEILGSDGVIVAPDPNGYAGTVRYRRAQDADWTVAPPTEVRPASRGVGVLDMARAIRTGRPHRATGEFALHVVDVMQAVMESVEHGGFAPVTSRFAAVPPLPDDWDPLAGTLTAATSR